MSESYTAAGYGRMVADPVRTEAYAAALRAAVRPGCVVLEIGTGTGVFALLAASLGARKVYAVDPADAIVTGQELARANGFAGRIEFVQELSTRVTLPERADVIVSDLRGALPPFQHAVATLRDARERHLAPGGVMIPLRDVLLAAPVEAPGEWTDAAGPAAVLGFDCTPARRRAVNEWTRALFRPEQLLAGPREWGALDYRCATSPDVCGTAEWPPARNGTAHGLAVWFRAELTAGTGFETGPGTGTIYRTAFFPWPEPVALRCGDRVRAELSARLVGDDYVWGWSSTIESPGRADVSFAQSTFLAAPPSPRRLRKRSGSHLPAVTDDARIDAYLLARMDGRTPLGDIARGLAEAFPERFGSWEAALSRAGTVSERYSA